MVIAAGCEPRPCGSTRLGGGAATLTLTSDDGTEWQVDVAGAVDVRDPGRGSGVWLESTPFPGFATRRDLRFDAWIPYAELPVAGRTARLRGDVSWGYGEDALWLVLTDTGSGVSWFDLAGPLEPIGWAGSDLAGRRTATVDAGVLSPGFGAVPAAVTVEWELDAGVFQDDVALCW
jgi:hypothetical protein